MANDHQYTHAKSRELPRYRRLSIFQQTILSLPKESNDVGGWGERSAATPVMAEKITAEILKTNRE
ncbi:MAG TPA: hypothetical protein DEB48_11775 [Verrucomicrobiales bacterium]|nr:hypothetical protein [Verrucomicrobiales bacterium]HBU60510.1 hypothetical protein [Verrucomicrobiales bacterium]